MKYSEAQREAAAHEHRALVLMDAGLFEEAYREIMDGLAHDPYLDRLHLWDALLALRRGDMAAARAAQIRAHALVPAALTPAAPAAVTAHMRLAEAFLARGQDDLALTSLITLVELDPGNVRGRLLLGDVTDRLGLPKVARRQYSEAVEIDPENDDARRRLASLEAEPPLPGSMSRLLGRRHVPLGGSRREEGDEVDARSSRAQPPYRQIAEKLRGDIDAGLVEPHDRLGTEDELMERFGVSRTPIIRALTELVRAGYVYRRRRHGTFVAERDKVGDRGGPLTMAQGLHPLEVKTFDPRMTPKIAWSVPVDHDSRVVRVLWGSDEGPALLQWIVLPRYVLDEAIYADGVDEAQEAVGRLSAAMRLVRSWAHKVWATTLDEDQAGLLGTIEGSPALVVETTGHLGAETQIPGYAWGRGDRFNLWSRGEQEGA